MKRWIQTGLLFLSIGLSVRGVAASFLEDRERGWYWFEEPKGNAAKDLNQPLRQAFDANKAMEKLQHSIQQALNLAILVPTEVNIQHYLNLQIKAFHLSQRFAEVAKLLQVKVPDLDYQIEAPYHHQANILKNRQDRIKAEDAAKQLATTHGLFFFFDSGCPYCTVMAPNVLGFANKHNFHLIPVSVGGGSLPEFPSTVPDNGIADAYGVTHLPALFAVNPKTNEVLKLANRVVSQTELEDVILRYQYRGQDYHEN